MHAERGETDGFYVRGRQNLSGQLNICLLSKTGWKKHFAKMDASGNTLDLWICS